MAPETRYQRKKKSDKGNGNDSNQGKEHKPNSVDPPNNFDNSHSDKIEPENSDGPLNSDGVSNNSEEQHSLDENVSNSKECNQTLHLLTTKSESPDKSIKSSPALEKISSFISLTKKKLSNYLGQFTDYADLKIIKPYKACDDGEISVNVNDKVTIHSIENKWIRGVHKETGKTGNFPTECLSSKDVSDFSNQSSFKHKESSEAPSSIEPLDHFIHEAENNHPDLPEELWDTLYSCLSQTLAQQTPCIILLLNNSTNDFTRVQKDIGVLSYNVLKDKLKLTPEAEYTLLNGADFKYSNNDGFFQEQKAKLLKSPVLLVSGLEELPVEVAKKFHSLCDTHDPAVPNAVIIFMLNHRHIKVPFDKNVNTYTFNILNELYGALINQDEFYALALRLANNIVCLNRDK